MGEHDSVGHGQAGAGPSGPRPPGGGAAPGATPAAGDGGSDAACRLLLVGWREWMALPQLGIGAIRAKIDTGARSSALHVDALECFHRHGREFVRFSLHPGRIEDPGVYGCEAEVADRRCVTDSGGHATERVFIHTLLQIAGTLVPIEINLTDRRNMLFPMLLGRTAMAGRLLVDPDRSFALGEPPFAVQAPAAR